MSPGTGCVLPSIQLGFLPNSAVREPLNNVSEAVYTTVETTQLVIQSFLSEVNA